MASCTRSLSIVQTLDLAIALGRGSETSFTNLGLLWLLYWHVYHLISHFLGHPYPVQDAPSSFLSATYSPIS